MPKQAAELRRKLEKSKDESVMGLRYLKYIS